MRLVRSVLALLFILWSLTGTSSAQGPGQTLLIVTPAAFSPELQDYVAYKSRNLPTRLVTLEEILRGGRGTDDAETLKLYLYRAWQKDRTLRYVLLVGDDNVLPVRYITCLPYTHGHSADAARAGWVFYACDTYYSALTRDDGTFDSWSTPGDGHTHYFARINGNSGTPINVDRISVKPRLCVGRWPCRTLQDVRTLSFKSENYEASVRSGKHPGLRHAYLCNPPAWVDARDVMQRVALPGWQVDRGLYQDGNPKFASYPPPDKTQTERELNSGVAFLAHIGHGGYDGWWSGSGTASLLDMRTRLHNSDRLPVIMSCGCDTAYFAPVATKEPYIDAAGRPHVGTSHGEARVDSPLPPGVYQTSPEAQVSLAKHLLRDGPNGAVAYIGAVAQIHPYDIAILQGFVHGLATMPRPTVGDCFTSGLEEYYRRFPPESLPANDDWPNCAQFAHGLKVMLYGDPSLPLASCQGP